MRFQTTEPAKILVLIRQDQASARQSILFNAPLDPRQHFRYERLAETGDERESIEAQRLRLRQEPKEDVSTDQYGDNQRTDYTYQNPHRAEDDLENHRIVNIQLHRPESNHHGEERAEASEEGRPQQDDQRLARPVEPEG